MLDEFIEVQQSLKGPGTPGWWDDLMPRLSEEQRASLQQAAESKAISHRTISIVLERWGHKVSPAQIGHWRRTYVR